jgi:M6 family metalloprotease-like protein
MASRHVRPLAGFLLAAPLVVALDAGVCAAHADRVVVRRPPPAAAVAGAKALASPDDARRAEAFAADRARLAEARKRLADRWGPLFRHDVRHRPLLDGVGRRRSAEWRDLLKAASGPPGPLDTVRIAAFRFEFENDSAGGVTTGDCRFDLSAPGPEDVIDPPPHNRAYFEAHFEALRRYWRAASSGNVHIEVTLFPPGDTDAFRLDDSADYLPEGDPASWTFESRGCGITRLVRDWIAYVDSADTAFHFGDYDSYLFLHAGPDLQGDVSGDTPGDIPSFNITFAFPDTVCGVDSIFVHDGAESLFIDNAWVIPETISQDFFIGALNGTFTHEFGHQLGLPDLYNTAYFFPSIGVWDLMDSGDSQALDIGLDQEVSGLIPGGISAWTRFFLGFESPVVVEGALNVDSLLASTLPDFAGTETRPRSILVPITPREYYLIENRIGELDGDLLPVVDADSATGVVLGPARLEVVGSDTIEVENYEYDFPLPGYGALIWHVDERALNDETIEVNAVNVNYYRRGLRLEEADGIPDLGNPNSIYFRGSPYDPFYEGNNDRLDPTSDPNSRSNDDLETGISVTEISVPGVTMSFQVGVAPRLPGFPVVLGDSLDERRSLLVGPTVGVAASGEASFAAVVGSDFFPDSVRSSGRVFGVPLPLGSAPSWDRALPESVSIPCVVADVGGPPGDEVIVLGDSGGVYVLGADGAPFPGADSTGRVVDLPGRFLFAPTVGQVQVVTPTPAGVVGIVSDSAAYAICLDPSIVVAPPPPRAAVASNPIFVPGQGNFLFYLTKDGRLISHIVDINVGGTYSTEYPELASDIAFLVWGDLDRDRPGNEWVGVSSQGRVTAAYFTAVTGTPSRLPGWPVDIGTQVFTYPSLGDLAGEGRLEILIAGEDGRVHVLEWNGARKTGWPVTLTPRIDGAQIPGETPLVVDFDSRPGAEVIVGIRDGRLMAYDKGGAPIPSWPYGTGEPFLYSPVAAFVAPSVGVPPAVALLTAPFDGFLYGIQIADYALESTIQWAGLGRDGANTFGYPGSGLGSPTPPSGPLLAASKTFAYPNPAKGNDTVIRFRLGRPGRVGMKIFDLSGELIREIPASDRPAGDNEYRWDLGGVASGVYLCRVEVADAQESSSALVKIAVSR